MSDRSPLLRRAPALLALVAVVAVALGWWAVRSREESPAAPPPARPASAAPAPLSASQVERGIVQARRAAEADPKDSAAWAMLAHSEEMAGRFEEATRAYSHLAALRPQDAQVQADYADALGVAQHGSLAGEPAKLIARALELDPHNVKALLLGGKEAFEGRRYEAAIALWQRALAERPDAALRQPVETSIAEARSLAAAGAGARAASAPAGGRFVAGRIVVDPALRSRIAPDDTVFVYARPASGSRMPVALLRRHGRDLPLDFALDDTLAMVPQARLSQQTQVLVGARVSHRGDAIPAAGDLEGEVGPVAPGTVGLQITIDHEHR